MEKIDLKKEYASLYNVPKNKMVIVDVPKLNYLMIDGKGNPNTSKDFQDAIETLYPVAYTLKFTCKKGPLQKDYGVMPLEGLWWMDDMSEFTMENKDKWNWTLMILQPDFIDKKMVDVAIEAVAKKKAPAALRKMRFESMKEGKCAQILHIGPYDQEPPNIIKLHDFIRENGYKLHGKHREIYLNDMRRTAPDKLKTIIRQPMTK